MLERLSVPRRAFDFEDYVDVLRRNFRWLIGPTFAGLVASTVIAYYIPDTYVSTALIRIVPQQISPELVQDVNSQEVIDHINGMAQSILSRNTLTSLINAHGLYKKEIKSEPMQDVIDKMRSPDVIGIRPLMGVTNVSGKSLPAMQVSFTYRDSHIAKEVCDDLVSRFMSQNSQDTLENNVATNQFMTDEFERAKRDLEEIEKKLQDFEQRNAGHLPEELQTNVSQMNALEQQLSALRESASRNSEQRMFLDSELHSAKDRVNAIKIVTPQTQAQNAKVTELDKEIDTLETNIASMKDRYTDDYPDLQAAKEQLALLKRQRDDAAKEKPKSTEAPVENPLAVRERLDSQAQIDQIQTALKANAVEAQRIAQDTQSVSAELRAYQGRLEATTPHQTEYNDLLRDQALAKQRYEDMETRRQKSTISMNLEQRKQGESLEVLDQASLPTSPTDPKRGKIIPIGAFGGLALGVILVAIREVKDTSLKNLKDARLYTQLSVLGSIPLLENDLVVQRRKQIMWIGWATGTIVGLAIMGVSVAHYYLNKG